MELLQCLYGSPQDFVHWRSYLYGLSRRLRRCRASSFWNQLYWRAVSWLLERFSSSRLNRESNAAGCITVSLLPEEKALIGHSSQIHHIVELNALSYCADLELSVLCVPRSRPLPPRQCCLRPDQGSGRGLLPWEHGCTHWRSSYKRAASHSDRRLAGHHQGVTSDTSRQTCEVSQGCGKVQLALPSCCKNKINWDECRDINRKGVCTIPDYIEKIIIIIMM